MFVRRFVAPVAIALGLVGLSVPQIANAAAPTPVTIKVTGVQTYGGQPTFTGTTGVLGMTCTGLSNGSPIAPTLAANGTYTIAGATCSGGQLSKPDYEIAAYTGLKLTVNRAPLVVTADDATKEYSDPVPPLTYTVTGFVNGQDASVLTGSPSIGTSATRGSVVGTYPIHILRSSLAAPSGNYLLNSFVPGQLTVQPNSLTVTVTGSQTYGGTPQFVGLTGTEEDVTGTTVSGVVCTALADGRAIAPTLPVESNLAVDPASCSGGVSSNPNHAVGSYQGGAFEIRKATLTVKPTDLSRKYGFLNPPLTYALSGFKNGDSASVVTGAPALSTTAVVKSNAGTYPIVATMGSLSAANYQFAFAPGTMTALKQQLTVAADPATRMYGAADPAYTATFTGFRNGDTVAALSGAPAFSTTATAASDPGVYPLTVAQGTLGSPNYTFAGFAGSTLTITPGVATITTKKMLNGVLTATITYGAANKPVVGSTITFTVGSTDDLACTAVTNALGKATCTVAGLVRTRISLAGYTARFPGTSALLPGQKKQGVL
jgi:hypothetical protein